MADRNNNNETNGRAIVVRDRNEDHQAPQLPWYNGLEFPFQRSLPANVDGVIFEFMGMPSRRNFMHYLLPNFPSAVVDRIVDFEGIYKEYRIVISSEERFFHYPDHIACRFSTEQCSCKREKPCTNTTYTVVAETSVGPIRIHFHRLYDVSNPLLHAMLCCCMCSYHKICSSDLVPHHRPNFGSEFYMLGADAAIFMFSCILSYRRIPQLYSAFCKVRGTGLPMVVCGAFSDRNYVSVKPKHITFPRKKGLPYFSLKHYTRRDNRYEKPVLFLLRRLTGRGEDLKLNEFPDA